MCRGVLKILNRLKIERIFITLFFSFIIIPFVYFIVFLRNVDMPKFSFEKFFSGRFVKEINGQFKKSLSESYLFGGMKANIDMLTKKVFSNDVYVENFNLLKIPKLPDRKTIKEICGELNLLAKTFKKPIYFLLIPTKMSVVGSGQNVSQYYGGNEFELKETFDSSLSKDIIKLDDEVIRTFSKDFNFFYRTDDVLTSLGAFLLYSHNISKLGSIPLKMEKFKIKHLANDYYGKLFSKIFLDKVKPDVIEFFEYDDSKPNFEVCEIFDDFERTSRKTLPDYSELKGKFKFSALLGKRSPIKTIVTNKNAKENVLIVGDENVNCFIQFFALNYEKITIIDLPQLQSLKNSLETSIKNLNCGNFSKIIFINGIEALSNRERFSLLFNILFK